MLSSLSASKRRDSAFTYPSLSRFSVLFITISPFDSFQFFFSFQGVSDRLPREDRLRFPLSMVGQRDDPRTDVTTTEQLGMVLV